MRAANALLRAATVGLGYGALFAVALVLRLGQLDQAMTARAIDAVATLAGGAVLSGIAVALLARRWPARWPRWLLAGVGAAALACGTLAAAGGVYAVILRDIQGSAEAGDFAVGLLVDVVLSHASAAYLMLLAGWSLLFPWPLAGASAATAIVLASWRR